MLKSKTVERRLADFVHSPQKILLGALPALERGIDHLLDDELGEVAEHEEDEEDDPGDLERVFQQRFHQ